MARNRILKADKKGRVKLSKNLYRDQFACRCGCGFDTVDANLIIVMQQIINAFGNRPIVVTSGARCKHHNDNMDPPGAKNSPHMACKACDFYFPATDKLPQVKDVEICKVIDRMFGDILYYYQVDHWTGNGTGRVVHVDVYRI